jgi:hypothetical protein
MADLFDRVAAMQARQAQAKQDRQTIEDAKQAGREQKRQEIRELMPEIAELVDLLRDKFGSGVRVLYAEESGQSIGKRERFYDRQS